jgi:hypothetical protein
MKRSLLNQIIIPPFTPHVQTNQKKRKEKIKQAKPSTITC